MSLPDGVVARHILIIPPDRIAMVKHGDNLQHDDDHFYAFLSEVVKYHPDARVLVEEVTSFHDLWVTEGSEWMHWHEMCMMPDYDPLEGEENP